jgi:hypothetical protein
MYPSSVDWTGTRAYPSFFKGTAGDDEVFNAGLVDTGAAPDWTIRAHTPTELRSTSTAIVMDVEHHVAVQFVLDGTSDSVYAWVDPDLNLAGPDMELVQINLQGKGAPVGPEISHISIDLRECDGTWLDNFLIHQTPNPPRNFSAEPGSGRAILSWDPPSATVLAGVKIVRRNDRFPLNDADGTVVYDGVGGYFEDFGVTTGETSYYTAFGYDQAGTMAEPVADSATVVQALGAENWKSYE